MGEMVSFAANGGSAEGWFAKPEGGRGPAVAVIQEWWGLVPHIQELTDRFAKEGFLALAPDLYHGRKTTSPDEAGRMLMELDVDRAEREIAGAGDFLLAQPGAATKSFGVVGFCMGGALAQFAATKNPKIAAAVSFYGGFKKVHLEWEALEGAVLLVYGGRDQGVPASQAKPLEEKLKSLGKTVETVVYPEAGHAFFNDHRPEVYDADAAADAWGRTVSFLRGHVERSR
jgi:carboxymethylenebutenolidase